MLNRRDAFRGLALTALAAGWAVPAVAAPPPAQAALTWAPKALTTDQARTLAAAAEAIMPATDTPGAIEAGVPQFVDRVIADWCEPADADRLKAGLTSLDADARMSHGAAFVALTPEQKVSVLASVEATAGAAARRTPPAPHFYPLLKELVTVGYFTSEAGATKALRYDPIPGAYHGCIPLKEIGRAWAT
jgi:glucoside 3-dehydrogenase (cytochrome c) hitch-hiker subunit